MDKFNPPTCTPQELFLSTTPAPASGQESGAMRSVALDSESGGGSLLYHNCNNSTGNLELNCRKLTPYHQKSAFVLSENCAKFIREQTLERVGFLTLTFSDNVKSHKEASRRFNSLATHFLKRFFGVWMLVRERQIRGAWHYHVLVDCRGDIRTGVDFDQIAEGEYSSASLRLRALWKLLRLRLPAYGFGRSELLPIRKESEAIAKYIGKYISKHIQGRTAEDKGVRLVSYSADFVRSSAKLAWHSDVSREWRRKLRKFATLTKCYNLDALQTTFGKHWAHSLASYIDSVDTLTPPEIDRIKNVFSRNSRQFRDDDGNIYPYLQPDVDQNGVLIWPYTGKEIF
jgi:hypothetical protein